MRDLAWLQRFDVTLYFNRQRSDTFHFGYPVSASSLEKQSFLNIEESWNMLAAVVFDVTKQVTGTNEYIVVQKYNPEIVCSWLDLKTYLPISNNL